MNFVYIIEAENGVVKIGCSMFPKERVNNCISHSPIPVRLIAQWPGDTSDERAFHRQFRNYRSHREWFRAVGDLAAFVESKRGTGVECVPAWCELAFDFPKDPRPLTKIKRSASMKKLWADPVRKAEWLDALQRGRKAAQKVAA